MIHRVRSDYENRILSRPLFADSHRISIMALGLVTDLAGLMPGLPGDPA